MNKLNCWEFMKCGREPDGRKVAKSGVCPVTLDASCDGINSGKNAGRVCWAIAGTFCDGKIQGSFVSKESSCTTCKVFKQIQAEEGAEFTGQAYQV